MSWLGRLKGALSRPSTVITGHETPWDPSDLLSRLQAILSPGSTLLEIHDIDGVHQGRHRLGLFEIQGQALTHHFDIWLPIQAHLPWHNLLESHGIPWRRGGWEAMFARRWKFAFTLDPRAPILVWDHQRRLLLEELPGTWRLPDGTQLPHEEITRVEVYINWGERHIRLHTEHGAPHTILTERAFMGMFYDGLDLMFDTWWLGVLARHIAQRSGAECWHNDVG